MRGRQGIKRRQNSALEMRKTQLAKGTKPEKVGGRTTNNIIPLTENDIKRIKTEIEVLSKRVS